MATMMTSDETRAREQAQAQLDSIRAMVSRLEHAGECSGDDECELTDQEILDGINIWHPDGSAATAEEREQYHDEDSAREAIDDDPLSVEVRSGWASVGEELTAEEYQILLCTGGPAVRIMGELDEYGQPTRAWIEYQDWFTPWAEYHADHDSAALLTYSAQFLG